MEQLPDRDAGMPSFRQHALGWVLCSPSAAGKALRLLLAAVSIGLGMASLVLSVESLGAARVYSKDFTQDYLWARSLSVGADPYRPWAGLAEEYLGFVPRGPSHPTPHSPVADLLLFPLARLDYPAAATLWWGLQVGFILASIWALGRTGHARLAWWATLGAGTAAFAWFPFLIELVLGQLSALSLVVLSFARLALLSNRRILSGALFGLAVLIRPVPWPLLLLFALRRDWRTLGTSGATLVLGFVITASVIGLDRLAFYRTVLPTVAELYKAEARNISLWTVGWRLFHGTDSPMLSITAPPLTELEPAAQLVSAGLPALVLLIACLVARKQSDVDPSLGMMICVSILVSPISWDHYLVLAAIPAAQVIGWLLHHRFPLYETNLAILAATLMLLPVQVWMMVAYFLAGQPPEADAEWLIPFAPSLLTLIPSLGVGALGWLVIALPNRSESRQREEPPAVAGAHQ